MKKLANELQFEIYEKAIDICIKRAKWSVTKRISERKFCRLIDKYAATLSFDEISELEEQANNIVDEAYKRWKNILI